MTETLRTTRDLTRRAVLVAGAGGAGAVALAACSTGSGDGGAGSGAAQAPGTEIAVLSAIPVGQAKSVSLADGSTAIVARPTATTAVCFSATCTHAGCTVAPSGARLNCPCHGSVFNALTGAVLNGPASLPLARIAVRVRDGKVVTG